MVVVVKYRHRAIVLLLTQLQVSLGQGSKNMRSWNIAALVEDTRITEP